MATENSIYPELTITKIKNPSRNWAIPILGGLAKIIILIPVFLEIAVLMLYIFLLQAINSLHVLFGQKYWPYCFEVTTGTFNLVTKTTFFFYGLSDKYPGFNLKLNGDFDLKFQMPPKPGIFYAIPILGIVARGILIIPFAIYSQVIGNGAKVGVVGSSFPVFFSGRYPDSTFELARDSARLSLSQMAYFAGISDKYPSFKINMDHQTIKIFLIIIGTLFLLSQWKTNHKPKVQDDYFKNYSPYMRQYQNQMPPAYQYR